MANFFPHFPLHLNFIALFGITLLLGILGGEIARRIPFLPRISGYILMGFLVGPGGFNILNQAIMTNAHFFVDISLSLVLFNLGRQLDFTWLRHDKNLLFTSITESSLTFVLIFAVFHLLFKLSHLQAALGATIAIATSPAIVMMVANDLSADGPITRRALILTSLNNLFSLLIFTMLLPLTQHTEFSATMIATQAAYRLGGSIMLGFIVFTLCKIIARLIGKQRENQFVLFVGAIVLTIGFAYALKFSSMLSLFILGTCVRNLDFNHALMEIDFGWLARLFFILLFVVIGAHIQIQALFYAPFAVAIFLLVRFFAKTTGILLFYKKCRLTFRQAYALSLTLIPMAGVAIGMSNILIDFNPDLGRSLLTIISAVVAILNLIGPILTQYAFIKTGEGLAPNKRITYEHVSAI